MKSCISKAFRGLITDKMVANYENRDEKEKRDESTKAYRKRIEGLDTEAWVCEIIEMWSILEDY